jgi:hypothetical protein
MIPYNKLSPETRKIMKAAMPDLGDFAVSHKDDDSIECADPSLQFSRSKVHCTTCGRWIVVYGGARAALKREREGKPHKQRHRKKMKDQLAAAMPWKR